MSKVSLKFPAEITGGDITDFKVFFSHFGHIDKRNSLKLGKFSFWLLRKTMYFIFTGSELRRP